MTHAPNVVIPSRADGEGPLNCALGHSKYHVYHYESVRGPSLRSG
jgi:hypothetical protein